MTRTVSIARLVVALVILCLPVAGRGAESVGGRDTAAYRPAESSIYELRSDVNILNTDVDLKDIPSTQTTALEASIHPPPYYVDYDQGLVLRPRDPQTTPFELRVQARLQFRYTGFKRDQATFSNQGDGNRGGPIRIGNRNDFEIERGRLIFKGFMFDPNLKYFINLDTDTDENHRFVVHDFWVYYEFSEAFSLNVGKAMVPGCRDWLNVAPLTHLADRSMATAFFRPSRTIGVWAKGRLAEDTHYHTMVGNGFNTTDRTPDEVDNRFVYSLSTWWEPLGDLGVGQADLSFHEEPALRLGHSITYSSQTGDEDGVPRGEQNFARLSDGTRLVTSGALAPGATVNEFDIYLYAIDAALKYRGFSINTEYFLRWLNEFGTTGGPVPQNELFDHGFYADVGWFVMPKKLELVGRISQVDGAFREAWEYAGGVNYFIEPTHFHKITFDVAVLDGCPVTDSGPNYVVGQDGVMFRLQYQVQF